MLELTKYQNQGLLWYGQKNDQLAGRIRTGFEVFDQALAGGLPPQGLFEIKTPTGIGEIRLLLPYLVQKQSQGLVVFIAPPNLINAEFLLKNSIELDRVLILNLYQPEEALWAAEQCLRSGCCSAVLLWQKAISVTQARRLLLASEQGESSLLLYRPQAKQQGFSIPATLSLTCQANTLGIQVRIDKQRGGRASEELIIAMHQQWPDLTEVPVEKQNNVLPFPQSATH